MPVTIDRRGFLMAQVAGAMFAAAGSRIALAQPALYDPPEPADIFLLRGLFGVFSLGMDSLAEKLTALGYFPSVWSWTDAPLIASNLVAGHTRGDTSHIILIGHSLGSNAVVQVAQALDEKAIPVDLAVTFDVTVDLTVPRNVAHFVNFYQHNGFGVEARPAPDFPGEFRNVDLSRDTTLNHGNIDEAPRLQSLVIDRVEDVTHSHVIARSPRRKAAR
jgi:hypothetical protein